MRAYQIAKNLARELATNSDISKLVAGLYQGKQLLVFMDTIGQRDFEAENIDIFPCIVIATDSASGGRGKDKVVNINAVISTRLPSEVDITKPLSTDVNNLLMVPGFDGLTELCGKIVEILENANLGAFYQGYSIDYDLESQAPIQYATLQLEFTELHSF